jgi:lysophospholipase L1-like esterase
MNDESMNRNESLLYVALGNSLTAGIGAGFSPGFVQRYHQFAKQMLNKRIYLQVIARPGATTEDILKMIQHPSIKRAIRQASIITLSAGGNDLIQAARVYFRTNEQRVLEEALHRCRENMANILKEIGQIKSDFDAPFIIRLVDLYNPLPDLELADKWVRLFNQHLGSFTNGQIAITNVYSAFKGKEDQFLSSDRLHPNPEGYQIIAEELNRLGYSPLV